LNFLKESIMAIVRVEQRNAHLAGSVKLEYVNGREGKVAKGSVTAISNSRRGPAESREEEATSIQWTLWGKQAENAAEYLGKGSHVVSVWPWHLELSRFLPEHRGHGEDGGFDLHGGDGDCRAWSDRGRGDRLDAQAGGGLRSALRRPGLLGLSRQAATCGAATLRSGCSTASADG
jgi:hypothetical protein